jgi:tetratricopeptide (TPR) repeat protein
MMTRALLVLLLLGGTARAGDPVVQAKAEALFDKGQAAYQAGDYQAAVPFFKDAYELVHDPVYLFNAAQSYRKLLDCENAFYYYNKYLAAADDADAKQREKVQQWLHELQPCVESRQREHADAKHNAELVAKQRAEDERRRQLAATPRTETVDGGRWYRIGGISAGAVGAIGLIVGITYSAKGSSIKSDLASTCAAGCNWDDPAIRAKDDSGHHANTLAAVGYIGGGIAIAGGVALYMLGLTKVEHVQVIPTAGGASVSASLTF